MSTVSMMGIPSFIGVVCPARTLPADLMSRPHQGHVIRARRQPRLDRRDPCWEDVGCVAHRGTAVGTCRLSQPAPGRRAPGAARDARGGARVTLLSAPAGSGKTSLLRSWSAEPDVEERVAWVTVGRRERDPQRFWLALLDALRATARGIARRRSTHPGS